MQLRIVISSVLALFVSSLACAAEGCGPVASATLEHYANVVGSLHFDKPGQALVYAADGSRFTTAEAAWLNGQMREARRACTEGDGSGASERLEGVRTLVDSRTRH